MLRPWDRHVVEQGVTETLERGDRQPPSLEQHLGLVGVVGRCRVARPGGVTDRRGSFDLGAPQRRRRVRLHEQQRGRVPVEAEVAPVVDGQQRGPVDQLDQRQLQPAGDEVRDGDARGAERREHRDHRGRAVRQRRQPHPDLGDDPERALAADQQLGQVETGDPLDGAPPGLDHGAVRHHDLETEDVVAGHPVLDAAEATGVRGDVAADRAEGLARRVGRVPQPDVRRRPRDVGVDDARLEDRHADRPRRPRGRGPSVRGPARGTRRSPTTRRTASCRPRAARSGRGGRRRRGRRSRPARSSSGTPPRAGVPGSIHSVRS